MTVRSKISITIASAFLCLITAIYVLYSQFVMQDYSLIEHIEMETNLKRVKFVVETTENQLLGTTKDWAWWDDTYDFMANHGEEFKKSWFTIDSFKALNITHAVFLNSNGDFDFGVLVDLENEVITEISKSDIEVRSSIVDAFRGFAHNEKPSHGLFRLKDTLLIAAAAPIMDTAREKPPRGVLILAMTVNEGFLKTLSEQTQLTLEQIEVGPTSSEHEIISQLMGEGVDPIRVVNEDKISGYSLFLDSNQKPAFALRTDAERPIYQRSVKTRDVLMTLAFCSLALTLIMTLFILHRTVLRRLDYISRQAGIITTGKDLSIRVEDESSDELGKLGQAFNQMLQSLDVAQRETARARDVAERANKMKDYFASNFSHDLGNKLGGVLHLIRNALKNGCPPETSELLNNCQSEITQIHGRTKRIIDMHKLETGNETFLKEPFSLRQAILNSRAQLLGLLSDKPVSIVFDIDAKTPLKLIGDVEKIGRVIENLLGNAAKFTHIGHIGLTVKAELCDDLCNLTLEVWDTGIGIPKEKLSTIFEAFQHAHSSADGEAVGHGIGLFSTLKIIEGLGGKIALNSEVGKGSNFSVFIQLPISEIGAPPKPQNWPPLSLVIDDDAISGSTLARNFISRGADARHTNITTLTTAGEADVYIISEQALKNQDVWNYAHEKANQVIILSNATSTKLRTELRQIGINRFVPSPTIVEEVFHLWRRGFESATAKPPELIKAVRPTTILLADDNPAQVKALKHLFEAANYTVKTFADGQGVVSAVSSLFSAPAQPDALNIVITDINMSGVSGTEATKAIRDLEMQHKRSSRIPIIALSGFINTEIKKDLLTNGFDAVLDKLAGPDEFTKLFKTLLP